MNWKEFQKLAEYRGEKETYFEMFFMHYLYYSIVECHSRKVSIRDVSRFFNNLYYNLAEKEAMKLVYYEYKNNAVCSSNSLEENDAEIIKMAQRLRKKSLYEKMFHLIDGYIVIDDGFSYSHNGAKIWGRNWSTSDLNIAFYYSEKELYDWQEPKWKSVKKLIGDLGTSYNQSLIEHLCKWHLNNPKFCHNPFMTPEAEGVKITPKNLELGEYIAAKYIYRCFKAWHRSNESYLSKLVRTPKILIKGVDYYPSAIKKETDSYRIQMIKKYPELARRFAFLIQTAKNDQIVFDSSYEPVEFKRLPYRDPDDDEAFRLRRKNYILDVVGSYHQDFLVMKNNKGEVLFKDSVSYSMSNLDSLSPEERKSIFAEKDYLEEELAKMKKEFAEKKEYQNTRQKYNEEFRLFIEEQGKTVNPVRIEAPFETDNNWYIESQQMKYFEIMFMHYLYYNVVNGYSKTITVGEILDFFNMSYEYLSNNERPTFAYEAISKYAFHNYGTEGIENVQRMIGRLENKPGSNPQFHLSKDYVVIGEEFSYQPLKEEGDSSLASLEPYIKGLCSQVLKKYGVNRKRIPDEISSNNIEIGKYLAAKFIDEAGLEELIYEYYNISHRFAVLLQISEPGSCIFYNQSSDAKNEKAVKLLAAEMEFRKRYLLAGIEEKHHIDPPNFIAYKEEDGKVYIIDSTGKRIHVKATPTRYDVRTLFPNKKGPDYVESRIEENNIIAQNAIRAQKVYEEFIESTESLKSRTQSLILKMDNKEYTYTKRT